MNPVLAIFQKPRQEHQLDVARRRLPQSDIKRRSRRRALGARSRRPIFPLDHFTASRAEWSERTYFVCSTLEPIARALHPTIAVPGQRSRNPHVHEWHLQREKHACLAGLDSWLNGFIADGPVLWPPNLICSTSASVVGDEPPRIRDVVGS